MPQDPEKQILSPEDYEDELIRRWGIPRNLVRAMTGQESSGSHYDKKTGKVTVGPKTPRTGDQALGKYQLMPDTARGMGLDPKNPYDNVYGGLKTLKQGYEKAKQSFEDEDSRWAAAITYYHGGQGGLNKAVKTGETPTTSDGVTTTRRHVNDIMRRYKELDAGGGDQEGTYVLNAEPLERDLPPETGFGGRQSGDGSLEEAGPPFYSRPRRVKSQPQISDFANKYPEQRSGQLKLNQKGPLREPEKPIIDFYGNPLGTKPGTKPAEPKMGIQAERIERRAGKPAPPPKPGEQGMLTVGGKYDVPYRVTPSGAIMRPATPEDTEYMQEYVAAEEAGKKRMQAEAKAEAEFRREVAKGPTPAELARAAEARRAAQGPSSKLPWIAKKFLQAGPGVARTALSAAQAASGPAVALENITEIPAQISQGIKSYKGRPLSEAMSPPPEKGYFGFKGAQRQAAQELQREGTGSNVEAVTDFAGQFLGALPKFGALASGGWAAQAGKFGLEKAAEHLHEGPKRAAIEGGKEAVIMGTLAKVGDFLPGAKDTLKAHLNEYRSVAEELPGAARDAARAGHFPAEAIPQVTKKVLASERTRLAMNAAKEIIGKRLLSAGAVGSTAAGMEVADQYISDKPIDVGAAVKGAALPAAFGFIAPGRGRARVPPNPRMRGEGFPGEEVSRGSGEPLPPPLSLPPAPTRVAGGDAYTPPPRPAAPPTRPGASPLTRAWNQDIQPGALDPRQLKPGPGGGGDSGGGGGGDPTPPQVKPQDPVDVYSTAVRIFRNDEPPTNVLSTWKLFPITPASGGHPGFSAYYNPRKIAMGSARSYARGQVAKRNNPTLPEDQTAPSTAPDAEAAETGQSTTPTPAIPGQPQSPSQAGQVPQAVKNVLSRPRQQPPPQASSPLTRPRQVPLPPSPGMGGSLFPTDAPMLPSTADQLREVPSLPRIGPPPVDFRAIESEIEDINMAIREAEGSFDTPYEQDQFIKGQLAAREHLYAQLPIARRKQIEGIEEISPEDKRQRLFTNQQREQVVPEEEVTPREPDDEAWPGSRAVADAARQRQMEILEAANRGRGLSAETKPTVEEPPVESAAEQKPIKIADLSDEEFEAYLERTRESVKGLREQWINEGVLEVDENGKTRIGRAPTREQAQADMKRLEEQDDARNRPEGPVENEGETPSVPSRAPSDKMDATAKRKLIEEGLEDSLVERYAKSRGVTKAEAREQLIESRMSDKEDRLEWQKAWRETDRRRAIKMGLKPDSKEYHKARDRVEREDVHRRVLAEAAIPREVSTEIDESATADLDWLKKQHAISGKRFVPPAMTEEEYDSGVIYKRKPVGGGTGKLDKAPPATEADAVAYAKKYKVSVDQARRELHAADDEPGPLLPAHWDAEGRASEVAPVTPPSAPIKNTLIGITEAVKEAGGEIDLASLPDFAQTLLDGGVLEHRDGGKVGIARKYAPGVPATTSKGDDFTLQAPEPKPVGGKTGDYARAFFRQGTEVDPLDPDNEEKIPAFYSFPETKRALGLGPDAPLGQVHEALREAIGKHVGQPGRRLSHATREDLESWAEKNGLIKGMVGRALQANLRMGDDWIAKRERDAEAEDAKYKASLPAGQKAEAPPPAEAPGEDATATDRMVDAWRGTIKYKTMAQIIGDHIAKGKSADLMIRQLEKYGKEVGLPADVVEKELQRVAQGAPPPEASKPSEPSESPEATVEPPTTPVTPPPPPTQGLGMQGSSIHKGKSGTKDTDKLPLSSFVRRMGGIWLPRDSPDRGEVGRIANKEGKTTGLVHWGKPERGSLTTGKPSRMSLEDMRDDAFQSGLISEDVDFFQFLDMIEDELRGGKAEQKARAKRRDVSPAAERAHQKEEQERAEYDAATHLSERLQIDRKIAAAWNRNAPKIVEGKGFVIGPAGQKVSAVKLKQNLDTLMDDYLTGTEGRDKKRLAAIAIHDAIRAAGFPSVIGEDLIDGATKLGITDLDEPRFMRMIDRKGAINQVVPFTPTGLLDVNGPPPNRWGIPRMTFTRAQVDAMSESAYLKELFTNARAEWRQKGKGNGIFWTNHQGMTLLQVAVVKLGVGGRVVNAGIATDQATALRLADVVVGLVRTFSETGPDTLQKLQTLQAVQPFIQALVQGTTALTPRGIAFVDSTHPAHAGSLRAVIGNARHELFHASGTTDSVQGAGWWSDPMTSEAIKNLTARGYPYHRAVLENEALTHLVAGQWELLGIRNEEAALQYLERSFRRIIKNKGASFLDRALMRARPISRELYEKVKTEEAALQESHPQTATAPTGVDVGLGAGGGGGPGLDTTTGGPRSGPGGVRTDQGGVPQGTPQGGLQRGEQGNAPGISGGQSSTPAEADQAPVKGIIKGETRAEREARGEYFKDKLDKDYDYWWGRLKRRKSDLGEPESYEIKEDMRPRSLAGELQGYSSIGATGPLHDFFEEVESDPLELYTNRKFSRKQIFDHAMFAIAENPTKYGLAGKSAENMRKAFEILEDQEESKSHWRQSSYYRSRLLSADEVDAQEYPDLAISESYIRRTTEELLKELRDDIELQAHVVPKVHDSFVDAARQLAQYREREAKDPTLDMIERELDRHFDEVNKISDWQWSSKDLAPDSPIQAQRKRVPGAPSLFDPPAPEPPPDPDAFELTAPDVRQGFSKSVPKEPPPEDKQMGLFLRGKKDEAHQMTMEDEFFANAQKELREHKEWNKGGPVERDPTTNKPKTNEVIDSRGNKIQLMIYRPPGGPHGPSSVIYGRQGDLFEDEPPGDIPTGFGSPPRRGAGDQGDLFGGGSGGSGGRVPPGDIPTGFGATPDPSFDPPFGWGGPPPVSRQPNLPGVPDQPPPPAKLTWLDRLKRTLYLIGAEQTGAQLLHPKFFGRNIAGHLGIAAAKTLEDVIAGVIDAAYVKATGKLPQQAVPTPAQLLRQVRGAIAGGKAASKYSLQGRKEGKSEFYWGGDRFPREVLTEGVGKKLGGRVVEGGLYGINQYPDDVMKGVYYGAIRENLIPVYQAARLQGISEETIIGQIVTEAQQASLQDPNFASKSLERIGRFFNAGLPWGFGSLLIKYRQIPGAFVKRNIEYSPLGLIEVANNAGMFDWINEAGIKSKKVHKKRIDPETGEVKHPGDPFRRRNTERALARVILGAGGMAVGGMMAYLGIITPKVDSRTGRGRLDREEGMQSYAINFSALKRFVMSGFSPQRYWQNEGHVYRDKEDTIMSIDWLQPWGAMLAIVSNIVYTLRDEGMKRDLLTKAAGAGAGSLKGGANKYMGAAKTGADLLYGAGKAGWDSLGAFLEALSDSTVLRSLARHKDKGLMEALRQTVLDIPSSFTPGLARSIKNTVDNRDYDTRVRGSRDELGKFLWEMFVTRPGARAPLGKAVSGMAGLKPDIGTYGQEKKWPQEDNMLSRGLREFLPATITKHKTQPISEVLRQANTFPGEPEFKEGKETDDQWRERKIQRGQTLMNAGNKMAESAAYKDASREIQIEMTKRLLDRIADGNRNLNPPDLKQAAIDLLYERQQKQKNVGVDRPRRVLQ